MMSSAFHGAAYSTAEQRYEKINFADMAEAKLDATTQAGWAGMLQHYFVTAWTVNQTQNHIYAKAVNVKSDERQW